VRVLANELRGRNITVNAVAPLADTLFYPIRDQLIYRSAER
jgi:NAD(P)-dependent dehydrogenase (short-subunit alcohol dehydrogenase family)